MKTNHEPLIQALEKITEYLYWDEKKSFDEQGNKGEHLFRSVQTLADYLKTQRKVDSVNDLIERTKGKNYHEFLLSMNGGIVSRKYIRCTLDGKKFYVINAIDNSRQVLSRQGLRSFTNIENAILAGAFYQVFNF